MALTTLALLGAAPLLAGCKSKADRAAAAMALGQQLAAQGLYGPAQYQFNLAVSLRDDIPELWLMRARNQIALKDYAGAFTSYRNVLDQDRTNREALDAMAQLALASNRLDDARKYAEQILALSPDDTTGVMVQATVAFRSGRYEAAQGMVERLMTLSPGNENGLILRARLLDRRGLTPEAIAVIEPVFQGQGGSDELRQLLGELYALQANGNGMLALARRDATDRQRDPRVQTTLGQRLAAVGDLPGALSALDVAHTIAPGREQRDATVRALADAEAAPVALAETLQRMRTPQPDLVLAVAQYALDRGQPAVAGALLLPIDGPVDPTSADRAGVLSFVEAVQGRLAEASRRSAAALAVDDGQPYALLARALVELGQRQLDPALRDAQQAASDNNQFAIGQAVLSRVLAARGDPLLADKALFDANNADKRDPVALRQLAERLVARNRAADALVYVRRYTIDNPASIAGWTMRQALCRRTGDSGCVARAAAVLDRLRGGSAKLPPIPADERPGILDLRDVYSGKANETT